MLKKIAAGLLAAILILTAVPLQVRAEMEYRFSDKGTIESDFAWGKDDIVEAIDFELYGGYPDGTLRLGNNITRAECAAVLSRVVDVSGNPGPNWYDAVVDGLVKAGIIPDKSGDWDAPITRLEAAKWLGRLARVYNVPVKEPTATFTDTTDPDAIYAAQTGLIKGVSAGVLGADQNLNRGQAAVLLLRVARSVDTNLPSDEELIQARREAIEDINANAADFEARKNVDLTFYEKLPYKRVTKTYFEGARNFMYATRNGGRKNNQTKAEDIRIAEKHNSIAIVVSKMRNDNGAFWISVSCFKKINVRWMMTQGGTPQNTKEWGYVSKVGW